MKKCICYKRSVAMVTVIIAVILTNPISVFGSNFYFYSENNKIELNPLPSKIVVKFRPEMKLLDREKLLTKFGLSIDEEGGPFELSYLSNPSKSLSVVKSLRKSSDILFAYPVFIWPQDRKIATGKSLPEFSDSVVAELALRFSGARNL